jgi:hypothetical protein
MYYNRNIHAMAGIGGTLFSPPSQSSLRPRPRQDALVSPPATGVTSALSPNAISGSSGMGMGGAPLTSTSAGMGVGPSFNDRTIPGMDGTAVGLASLRTPSSALAGGMGVGSFAPLSSSRASLQQAWQQQEQEEQALRHEYERRLKQLSEDKTALEKRYSDLKVTHTIIQ